MREILFRGKTKNLNGDIQKGSWVYGDLARWKDGENTLTNIYGFGEVIPDTVGQYTGLTDKNGKKIFEGDIVRRKDKSVWEIAFFENITRFAPRKPGIVFAMFPLTETEIVGNIHDNPELLKGGAE